MSDLRILRSVGVVHWIMSQTTNAAVMTNSIEWSKRRATEFLFSQSNLFAHQLSSSNRRLLTLTNPLDSTSSSSSSASSSSLSSNPSRDSNSIPFWRQDWFPWIAGAALAVLICSILFLVICLCWCFWRNRNDKTTKLKSFLFNTGGIARTIDTSKTSSSFSSSPSLPPTTPATATTTTTSLQPLSCFVTHASHVQPIPIAISNSQTTACMAGGGVLPSMTTLTSPQLNNNRDILSLNNNNNNNKIRSTNGNGDLSSNVTTNLSSSSSIPPVLSPGSLVCSGSMSGSGRRHKGLFESRRGSNASLTLSLSSSADSIPSAMSLITLQQDQELLSKLTDKMTIQQLKDKLDEIQRLHLQNEFNKMPMNYTPRQDIRIMNIRQKTRHEIYPNDQTRVTLPMVNGDILSTYINANYIMGYKKAKKAFVATEGPIPSTVIDFWRMIWHTEARIIVMITDLIEDNKKKCERYFPTEDYETFGCFEIKLEKVEHYDGFVVRQLQVKNANVGSRCVYHVWYSGWLDHATPTFASQLLNAMEYCRSLQSICQLQLQQQPSPSPPPPPPPSSSSLSQPQSFINNGVSSIHQERRSLPLVVHCSAGLGRTGCFLALWIASDQLLHESYVNILSIVAQLRLQRGGLVQTCEQYQFIHEALYHWWETRHSISQ